MQRETVGVTVLTLAVVAVLGVGGWLWFTTAPGSSTSATGASEADAGATPATRYDVPRCPVRLRPGADFERVPLDRKTPHLRLQSSRRGITVDVSCKSADEQFDRDRFLEQTLEAVRQKYADDLLGERQFDLGEASGWTLRAERDGAMRFVNVLIHERDIVLINVAGPVDPESREFNKQLVGQHVQWPGVR